MSEALTYEQKIARDYTRGTEHERLRLERLEPYAIGDLYEHGKCWQPWPKDEAEKMRAAARAILFDPNHAAEHHGDWSEIAMESCAVCVLSGTTGAIYPSDEHDDSRGPNWAGWERIYVQTGATIPDAWRETFADVLDGENQSYSDALGRDIVTFGLRDPRGIVRAPRFRG